MNAVALVAEQVIVDHFLSNKAPISGKNKVGLGLFALSGISFIAGLGFVVYAAHLYIAGNYPPEVAALLTGGLAISLALVMALLGYAFLKYRKYKLRHIKEELIQTIQDALELMSDELAEPIRENPKTSVLIASLAGFIAGDKFL